MTTSFKIHAVDLNLKGCGHTLCGMQCVTRGLYYAYIIQEGRWVSGPIVVTRTPGNATCAKCLKVMAALSEETPEVTDPDTLTDAEAEAMLRVADSDISEELKRAFVAGCEAVLEWTHSGMDKDDLDAAGYAYAALVERKTAKDGK